MSYPTRLLFEKTVLVSDNVHVVEAFDEAHLLDDVIPFLSCIARFTPLHHVLSPQLIACQRMSSS
jgi:hypothetical protein